jgi:hypothetical protein
MVVTSGHEKVSGRFQVSDHGGPRPGSGRKPGGKNKLTVERELRAAHGVQAAHATGLMPLDIMLARMRDEPLPSGQPPTDEQFQAAVAAAPYIHPRLSAVAVQPPPPPRKVLDLSCATQEELRVLLSLTQRGAFKLAPQIEGCVDLAKSCSRDG